MIRQEFQALVEDKSEGGKDFLQQWQMFSMDQQATMMKLMSSGLVKQEVQEKAEAGATSEVKMPTSPGAVSFFADSPAWLCGRKVT